MTPRSVTRESVLRAFGMFFLVVGLGAFAWCGAVLIGTAMFNRYESWKLSEQPVIATSSVPPGRHAHRQVKPHTVIGRLEIPRLDISTVVVEGDDDSDLLYGAGHIPGTSLPDEQGNFGVAAHRDRSFRPLKEIAANDRITVDTPQGRFEYRVESTEIVSPDDVQVLQPSKGESGLVLVTCYPFRYFGPAPMRFIVHARRVG